jgi:hypothetical protein
MPSEHPLGQVMGERQEPGLGRRGDGKVSRCTFGDRHGPKKWRSDGAKSMRGWNYGCYGMRSWVRAPTAVVGRPESEESDCEREIVHNPSCPLQYRCRCIPQFHILALPVIADRKAR